MFTTTHDVSTGLTRIIEHTEQEKAQWEADRAARLAGAKDRHNTSMQSARAAAYAVEADPLFFKSQRDEATAQQWQDKVAEIKARFPYQE